MSIAKDPVFIDRIINAYYVLDERRSFTVSILTDCYDSTLIKHIDAHTAKAVAEAVKAERDVWMGACVAYTAYINSKRKRLITPPTACAKEESE